MDKGSIAAVDALQLTSEKRFRFSGTLFVDCTGDGTVSALAGCGYMNGRESKSTYGESHALESADHKTMGNSIYWQARDTGAPVPFEKPAWAYTYTDADLALRPHGGAGFEIGFWWLEAGGDILDTLTDAEDIRDELWKIAYDVWDHIKNHGDHRADNFVLDTIGIVPGKRESRRIYGHYVLREQDLVEGRLFDDAVAYGGWTMDIHVPGGIGHPDVKPNYHISNPLYTIPYRSLVARDCGNLFIGGRLISATHLAFGSTRVMATCAVIGQAIGTAAGLCTTKKCAPLELLDSIDELQQALLADGCFIPGIRNHDKTDHARQAVISSSSHIGECIPANVVNGISRNDPLKRPDWIPDRKSKTADQDEIFAQGDGWVSQSLDHDPSPVLELHWQSPVSISAVQITFDTNLSFDFAPSTRRRKWFVGFPPALIKNYELVVERAGTCVYREAVSNNRCTRTVHVLPPELQSCDSVKIAVRATHGSRYARIFEVRCYAGE